MLHYNTIILYTSTNSDFYVNFPHQYINKIQQDAPICRYLFTAKLLYMFRVSSHPLSGAHETITATSGTGHVTYQGNNLPPAWPN